MMMKLESLGKASASQPSKLNNGSLTSSLASSSSSASPSMGLRFAVPSSLASEIRRRQEENQQNTENTIKEEEEEEPKQTLSAPDSDASTKNNDSTSVPVSPPSQQQRQQHQPNLPTVVLDVEQIVGYKPKSVDEVETIREQMMTAMWQRYCDTNDQSQPEEENKQQQEIPPPDFDDQIVDLLHAKMARFGNTETSPDHDDEDDGHRQPQPQPQDNQPSKDDGKISVPSTIRLQYPPQIQRPSTSSSDGEIQDLVDTAELWKDIDRLARTIDVVPTTDQQDEPENTHISFLERLTKHLKATGQSLLWKHDMATELESMARSEKERISLDEWTTSTRQTKLEHLYSIRETLVHQEELAKHSYDTLNDEREEIVKQAMLQHDATEKARRRRQQLGGGGWLVDDDGNIKHDATTNDDCNNPDPFLSNNFGTSALDFPEDFKLLGMVGSNNPDELEGDDQDEWSVDDDDDYDEFDDSDSNDDCYGEHSENGQRVSEDGYENDDVPSASADDKADNEKGDRKENDDTKPSNPENQEDVMPGSKDEDIVDLLPSDFDQTGDAANEPHVLSTPFQKRQERRRKAKLRKRQERKEAARRAQAEQRKAVETQIRAEHTSNDLILAETFLRAIESKVKSVDDLLESLQEEVWEAEEEDEGESDGDVRSNKKKPNSRSSTPKSDEPSLSLLDQILAMILGGLPLEPGITEEEHFAFIKNEHAYIVKGWEKHFGRLPPPIGYDVNQDKDDGFSTSSQRQQDSPKTETLSPEAQRLVLGIVDNCDDDWDAPTDDEGNGGGGIDGSKLQKSHKTVTGQNKKDQPKLHPVEPPKPKRTGLRPGGRAKP